jgi:glutaredoxin 3
MIEIYGTATCPWCDRAIEVCEQNQLTYEYKQLDDRFDGGNYQKEFKERLPNAKTVPQIFWHGKHIGGYNDFLSEIENTRNFGQEKL